MSFKFNFDVEGTNDNVAVDHENPDVTKQKAGSYQDNVPEEREAEEIKIKWDAVKSTSETQTVSLTEGQVFTLVASDDVEKTVASTPGDSDVSQAVLANSDLLPRVYEGGMKIWECSIDLAEYLSSLHIAFRGMKVLELGSGAGLPGLVALSQGAHVTFQDYNKEVLSLITATNIVLNNTTSDGCRERCQLVSGDWKNVQKFLESQNKKYDYILTSETLYSRESYDKLHNIMESLLDKHGCIYLASKTYYFGVGGGTREFETLLEERGVFSHKVCKVYTEGVQREILKLTFKT